MAARVEPGWIVLVPPGTRITRTEDRRVVTQRQAHVAVVDHVGVDARDLGAGPYVCWQVGEEFRWALAGDVVTLQEDDHRLDVGHRRVVGGHPVRGMGSIYSTSGSCRCGERFDRCQTAREVRKLHREHVLVLADTYMEASDMGRAPGLERLWGGTR